MQEEHPLASLRRRIVKYEQGVPGAVIDLVAVAQAEQVLAQTSQPDLETAAVLAWFHWYRHLETTERHESEEAARISERLFFRMRELAPEAVLPPLMDQAHAAHTTARQLDVASAAALVRDASRSCDPDMVEWTLMVLIQAEELAIAADAHSDRVVYRCLQGHQWGALYELLGDAEDLDTSIADLSFAVRHAPDDPVTAAAMHGYLGRAHLRRFQLHALPEDLRVALVELRQAYQGLDPLGPNHPEWLVPAQNLAAALLLDRQYADAREVLLRVLSVHPRGSLHEARTRDMLGSASQQMYLAHSRPEDLDACVQHLRAACATPLSTPEAARLRAGAAPRLAAALGDLYDRDGDVRHLDEATQVMRECLEQAEPLVRVQLLVKMAEMHSSFYARTGNGAELKAAVAAAMEVGYQAATATDESLSAQWETAIGPVLAQALCDRFRLESDLRDLDLAVETAQRGMRLAGSDERNLDTRVSCAYVLAHALALRGEATGSRTDADDAVHTLTAVVDVLPAGSPQRGPVHALLGNALRARATMYGDAGDFDAAIVAYSRALEGGADHFVLTGFATARLERFQRLGAGIDLEEAIDQSRAAARVAPQHERHTALNVLATALRLRFVLFGDRRDLDEAIEQAVEAAEGISPRHAMWPIYLSNLAQAIATRFHAQQEPLLPACGTDDPIDQAATHLLNQHVMLDVDTAIDLLAEALEAVPPGHRLRPGLLGNLAHTQAARFEVTSLREDHQAALASITEALDECPAARVERARLLHLRARLLLNGAEAGKGPATAADRAAALDALQEAAEAATVSPALRLRVLREVAEQTSDVAAALSAYEQAVACLPLVAWHGLGQGDREEHIARVGALSQEAAAAALDAGRPERAVELLEQGRAILWGQSVDAGSDFDAVRRAAPELAEQLDRVHARRLALDAVPGGLNSVSADGTDLRMTLAHDWDALCERVRRDVPGCANFLRPPDFAHLSRASAHGTVILVNVAERRSDAIALTAGDVTVIPLPRLTPDDTQRRVATYMDTLEGLQYMDLLSAAGGSESDASGQLDLIEFTMQDTLDWLWDAVAGPVLDALGYQDQPDGVAWPRVWWCPTGPLSFLPFHAAGRYRPHPRPGDCVLDRVVSSYTPTLLKLIEARGRAETESGRHRMLVVAMPETPGRPSLPDAEEDIESVTGFFPDRTTVIAGPAATRDAVCRALDDHSRVHFSCHGVMRPLAPSDSGLHLHDGILTVTELARLRLHHAEFAFLSSCETALSGYLLPDEALHVAGALHFAGFRHVVGTMWTVLGRYSGFVADCLYDRLTTGGDFALDECALALHHTLRELRAQPDMELAIWTPFVHTGP